MIVYKNGGFMPDIPLVTVITPTNNIVDNELTDDFNLLVSLLDKQNYPNIEHIVIDKASKDGTVQLLQDYKNKGYIQYYSEFDNGKFAAINKGIMHANGKYVTFLGCDDFIHNIMAISQIIEIMENYDAAFSYGASTVIHPEGVVFPFEPSIYNAFQVMPCAKQAMFFKKSVLAAEGYFDEKFKNMADFDMVIRLMLKEYTGVLYNNNYVTWKLSEEVVGNPDMINNEIKAVYIKNYRNLVQLTDKMLEDMVTYSKFPQPLLDRLAQLFPDENRQEFLDACENMYQTRYNLLNPQTEADESSITEEALNEEEVQTEQQSQPQPQKSSMNQSGMGMGQASPRPAMPGMSGMPRPNPGLQTNPQMNPTRPQMPPRFQ